MGSLWLGILALSIQGLRQPCGTVPSCRSCWSARPPGWPSTPRPACSGVIPPPSRGGLPGLLSPSSWSGRFW